MSVLFKTNPVLWEQNEQSGFRSIHVEYKGNTVVAIIANKTLGKWTAQVVPMGYSYTSDEVQFLAELYRQVPFIINVLEGNDTLSHEDVIDFLGNLHV
ncbi:hypothetical protein N0S44_000429 [Escherichia coli]|nr:hypothetical protein [Escherichia coli]EJR1979274.1 hypothetical protein [Escherichia coli]UTS53739.1 hypothetical protein UES1_372 [Escherichia phage UE-S1]